MANSTFILGYWMSGHNFACLLSKVALYDPGYRLSDLVILRLAYKKCRELARRMKFYRGENPLGHPKFPEGSPAAAQYPAVSVDILSPDIIYSPEDDDAIDRYHREYGESSLIWA